MIIEQTGRSPLHFRVGSSIGQADVNAADTFVPTM